MEFISVAGTGEIPVGAMKSFQVKEKDVLVLHIEGNYYAIDKKCTHMGGNLSKGKLEGKIVTCPLHGSKFDVTTGKNVQGPKVGFIKLRTGDLGIYPVKIENEKIQIGI